MPPVRTKLSRMVGLNRSHDVRQPLADEPDPDAASLPMDRRQDLHSRASVKAALLPTRRVKR
jgi:hypothetical protein